MAKAALEAIGGFNLFGKGHGSAWSKIMVKNQSLDMDFKITSHKTAILMN